MVDLPGLGKYIWCVNACSLLSCPLKMFVGDLVYSRLLGKDIIIINSERVAEDLLENRSSNYSDRPYLITSELSVFVLASHS